MSSEFECACVVHARAWRLAQCQLSVKLGVDTTELAKLVNVRSYAPKELGERVARVHAERHLVRAGCLQCTR